MIYHSLTNCCGWGDTNIYTRKVYFFNHFIMKSSKQEMWLGEKMCLCSNYMHQSTSLPPKMYHCMMVVYCRKK